MMWGICKGLGLREERTGSLNGPCGPYCGRPSRTEPLTGDRIVVNFAQTALVNYLQQLVRRVAKLWSQLPAGHEVAKACWYASNNAILLSWLDKDRPFLQLREPSPLKMGEVEEMFKKIMAVKGVQAVIAMTSEGIVIRSTMEQASAVHYAAMYAPLVHEGRMAVGELGGENLKTIRLRTTKHEIIIIPGKLYNFLVMQQPDASFD